METETNVGGAHRADRPELTPPNPGMLRVNPWVACENLRPSSKGRTSPLHSGVCPKHHPWVFSRMAARHRGASQAVAS